MKKLFQTIREKIVPTYKYAVEVLVHDLHSDKAIGRLVITTDARSKRHAKRNAQTFLRLHIGKAEKLKPELKVVK